MTDAKDEMRREVQERIDQAQAANLMPPEPDASPGITRKFVQECLSANELGDGALYARLHRAKFVYNNNAQEWFKWGGHHWERDNMHASLAAVERVSDAYLNEYRATGEDIANLMAGSDENGETKNEKLKRLKSRQEAILTRVRQLRTHKRRTVTLMLANTIDEPLAISGEQFDDRPMLFPCANGVIDLETGELNPGDPADFLSLASPVEFRGINEPAPLWQKSLMEIFGESEELVAYAQRLFGYILTGLVQEKVFPVLYGRTGWNGRSLIVETISGVMGDLAASIPSEMLLSQRYSKSASGPSPDIMSLKGKRLAASSEIDDGQRFSTSKIKWLTGKDTIVGRSPHDKYQTQFKPTHKLLVMTNVQPSAPPNDKAFWERLHLIPFRISFVNRNPQEANERRAILDLQEQIEKETPGILAWLVRGCLLWQKEGLNPPKDVLQATEEYRRNEDMLADWRDACCIMEPGAHEKSKPLYDNFVRWYKANIGDKEPNPTWFGKQMGAKFEKSKSHGSNVYRGVALKEPEGGE
jgi:putative DNA primase/helicase